MFANWRDEDRLVEVIRESIQSVESSWEEPDPDDPEAHFPFSLTFSGSIEAGVGSAPDEEDESLALM